MAKSQGKSLVIVESPAKARTIAKFLGNGYQVEASIGHIRDLPSGAKEVPDQFRSEPWAYLGVNVEENFEPVYVIPADKKKQISKLKDALKEAKDLYLATDEDREGEAISWHLHQVLKPRVPVHRLVFHEITREAIQNALSSTREIDEGLVSAQETRRILDRLYGYDVSQLLWKKVRPQLSAGRVQSVAVRLIVERERERMKFHEASWWDLEAVFITKTQGRLPATLMSVDGRRLPLGKDFDSTTGQLKDKTLMLLDETSATALANRLRTAAFKVTQIELKPFVERPKAPFTTSTLQQEANRKLGFTAKRTMDAAQRLYENGYITYMRTDSTILAQVAIDAARDLVQTEYGKQFLSPEPRQYQSKVKNAQEAHEAIRPAGHPFRKPQELRGELDSDQYRLFELIWKRTIASQMADARKRRVIVTIEGGGAVFQATGTVIEFEGFLRAYVEGSDDPEAELADKETILPDVQQNQPVEPEKLDAKGHTTQAPSRYSEAALTRALEELGIGRPSTYASIIETIQNERRGYVFKKGNALVPTWTAFCVTRLLEEHFHSLVDYAFTAQMEDLLDSISRKEAGARDYLQQFYFGDEKTTGLKPRVKAKEQEIDPREMAKFSLGVPEPDAAEVFVRVGRYGPFLEQGERRASIPDQTPPDELTLEKAMELLDSAIQTEEPLGIEPESGKPIYLKQGRFGPYIQLGENDDKKKRNASLLRGMNPNELDLPTALRLLSLPRTLGDHPELNEPIVASDGRFGPYIKCGSETRSLPAGLSPLDVTYEQAMELLKQPKNARASIGSPQRTVEAVRKQSRNGEPGQVVRWTLWALPHRWETNASLPKGSDPQALTFEAALQLLAERAAMGAVRRKSREEGSEESFQESSESRSATREKGVAKKRSAKKKA